MSVETWGLLPKAQDDSQTINDAINAAIVAHEADPEAHQGEGESLQNHKSDEVIDHPAGSVVNDKIPANNITLDQLLLNRFYCMTNFANLDGFDLTSNGVSRADLSPFGMLMYAGENTNNYIRVMPNANGPIFDGQYEDFFLSFVAYVSNYSDQKIHLGLGLWNGYFAGFKFTTDHVYACTFVGGVEHTTELFDFDDEEAHQYAIKHNHGVSDQFYVDGNLVHTEVTYRADGAAARMFDLRNEILEAGESDVHIGSLIAWREHILWE